MDYKNYLGSVVSKRKKRLVAMFVVLISLALYSFILIMGAEYIPVTTDEAKRVLHAK